MNPLSLSSTIMDSITSNIVTSHPSVGTGANDSAGIGIGPVTGALNNTSTNTTMEENIRCFVCGYGGCDIRISPNGLSVHARCIPLVAGNINHPRCVGPINGLTLYPMNFQEIDTAASQQQQTGKRGKKRKNPSSLDTSSHSFDPGDFECRTGRWTAEEMAFCDKLIEKFKAGELPLTDGTKLNDFLASMLKSKQSRLTKKMKNANLSGKTFKRTHGYIASDESCREFSEFEDAFFRSIVDPQERAEIRFHVQKEWREMFSQYCVAMGQSLDVDAWLNSVEEMEKRESKAKDAARMARRKVMMGIALYQDTQNPDQGVHIDKSNDQNRGITGLDSMMNAEFEKDEVLALLSDKSFMGGNQKMSSSSSSAAYGGNKMRELSNDKHCWHYASPFLGKIISYIQRHGCPFEHVDAWVPSYVPDSSASEGSGTNNNNNKSTCRLCFAGSATAEIQSPQDVIGTSTTGAAQPLSQEELFNLLSFGEYSQKFSFNVGCGLPGRVYESGIPAWEQSVHNAPHRHFERCGGAIQWGIKTVVGIPVPSPTVGRIVVVVYSKHDRNKDQGLVGRLYEEFKKLVPSPKWKLVVDIGKPIEPAEVQIASSNGETSNLNGTVASNRDASHPKDTLIDEVVALLGEQMPHDPSNPFASYLPNFMSLRLMLLKPTRSPEDQEIVRTLLSSYSSYVSSGRHRSDIAVMIARDFIFLKQNLDGDTNNNSNVGGNSVAGNMGVGIGVNGESNGNMNLMGPPAPNMNPAMNGQVMNGNPMHQPPPAQHASNSVYHPSPILNHQPNEQVPTAAPAPNQFHARQSPTIPNHQNTDQSIVLPSLMGLSTLSTTEPNNASTNNGGLPQNPTPPPL